MDCKFVKGQKYACKENPNDIRYEFVGLSKNGANALFIDPENITCLVRRSDGVCVNGNTDYAIITDEMTDKEKATLVKLLNVTSYGTTAKDVLNGYVRAMPKLMLDILRETYGRKE